MNNIIYNNISLNNNEVDNDDIILKYWYKIQHEFNNRFQLLKIEKEELES